MWGAMDYTAAKHGVVGFFEGRRHSDMARRGVRINVVCPGLIETGMSAPNQSKRARGQRNHATIEARSCTVMARRGTSPRPSPGLSSTLVEIHLWGGRLCRSMGDFR